MTKKRYESITFTNGCVEYSLTQVKNNSYELNGYSKGSELYQVYPSGYSDKKATAMAYCKSMCSALNGRNFRISSRNGFMFTVEFDFVYNGKQCVAHITKDHNYYCEVTK